MTLQELSDWIYAEYEAKYNEMERTDDRLEQIMLDGFTDGLLHVMAYLQPCIAMVQAEEKPQKKNLPQCVNCWWYSVEAEKACEKCGMCAFDE